MYCFVINRGLLFLSFFFFSSVICRYVFPGESTPSDSYFPGKWHVPRNGLIVYLSLGDPVY